jgi:predicted MFS family arabinose efflux permease
MTTKSRALIAIYIISFVLMLFKLTNTTIAYIIHSFPHLSPASVQQLISLPSIFGIIVSLALGPLILRINKKYLTLFTAFMLLIYFTIFSIVGSKSITPLLVATVFAGIAQGSAMTLISSMIGEFIGRAEKSANYVAAGFAVLNGGVALMSIVGGAIAAGNGGASWPRAYYLGAIIIPAIIAFGILMPKKPNVPEGENRTAVPEGTSPQASAEKGKIPFRVISIGILSVFAFICISGFLLFVSVYIVNVHKLGTSVQAGIVNSIFTITTVVSGFTYGIWSKVFKKLLIVVAYGIVILALFCMMTFTSTLFGAFAAAFFLGWSFSIINSGTVAFIVRISPPRLAPVGISIFQAGLNLGISVAIYALNFLSGFLGGGLNNILFVCTAGMAVCTVAAFFVFRTKDAAQINQAAMGKTA